MFSKKWLLEKDENKNFIIKLIITLCFIAIIFLVYQVLNIIILLILSLFLNILFAPILNKLNKIKIGDTIWIILIYISIILFILVMFYTVVPIFIKQISVLINIASDYVNSSILLYNTKWIDGLWFPKIIKPVLLNLDVSEILNSIKNNIWEISSFVSTHLKNFLTSWAGIIFSITNIVMNFVLVFIFTFFIALERKDIRSFFYKIMPEKFSHYILWKEDKIVDTLSNWLKSQLILWVSIFTITFVWLYFIKLFWVHIDEIFTLALIAGMMEFVPYIWPFIALLPALAIALWLSMKASIIILVLYIIIQQLENNILVPYVMWKNLSLSPFSVLIAMVLWASLFWIVWIILSVPLVSIIQIFLSHYLEQKKVK